MKSLLIVRHAIAYDRLDAAAEGMPDHARPLTNKGEAKMRRIAQRLAELLPKPASLLSSPYLRTRQTASILARQWGVSAEDCADLQPDGNPYLILKSLQNTAGPVVIVGHEPDLSELIGLLLCGQASSLVRLKKGGAALLHLEEPIETGKAQLQWHMNPKQLLGQG